MFRQLIKFPNHLGQTKLGVAQTPYSLQKLIRSDITQHMVSVTRDLYVNLFNLFQKNQTISGPRINLGGDHSMSLATVADSLERHDNLKVVWMDAHCDLNTYNSSPSKNMHGMPLSFLTGLEKPDSIYNFSKKKLPFKDILYIGIRDLDPFEQKIMNKHSISYINVEKINNNPLACWKMVEDFVGSNPVHLSFDVDVLDPTFMPCTGTPVRDGLDTFACKYFLERFLETNLVSTDIVELNLELGLPLDKIKTMDLIQRLLKNYIF